MHANTVDMTGANKIILLYPYRKDVSKAVLQKHEVVNFTLGLTDRWIETSERGY
jgi:hypothetical protein